MRAQLLWEKFQFWKKITSNKELKQENHSTKNYKTGKTRQNNKQNNKKNNNNNKK